MPQTIAAADVVCVHEIDISADWPNAKAPVVSLENVPNRSSVSVPELLEVAAVSVAVWILVKSNDRQLDPWQAVTMSLTADGTPIAPTGNVSKLCLTVSPLTRKPGVFAAERLSALPRNGSRNDPMNSAPETFSIDVPASMQAVPEQSVLVLFGPAMRTVNEPFGVASGAAYADEPSATNAAARNSACIFLMGPCSKDYSRERAITVPTS